MQKKPPIGVLPHQIFIDVLEVEIRQLGGVSEMIMLKEREKDLTRACVRYMTAGLIPDMLWYEEISLIQAAQPKYDNFIDLKNYFDKLVYSQN